MKLFTILKEFNFFTKNNAIQAFFALQRKDE